MTGMEMLFWIGKALLWELTGVGITAGVLYIYWQIMTREK